MNGPAPRAASWIVGGASVQGAAHRRRGIPNQDAVAWMPRAPAESFVAAVSDGHGAPAHFNSDVGAELAVSTACTVLEWFVGEEPTDAAAAGLAPDIVAAWQAAVARREAEIHPDTGWIENSGDVLLAYGATLLAVSASPAATIVLQIGDGDLLLGFPDGAVRRPLPDDAGLVGEQTHSLCGADAPSRFRIGVLRHGDGGAAPDFVMMSTDGLGKSFADEAALMDVARHYRRAMLDRGGTSALDGLERWLDAVSARGSGDDVTLCVAVKRVPPPAEHDQHVEGPNDA